MFSIRQNFTQRSSRLPRKRNLLGMDTVYKAQPFVQVVGKNEDTIGLNFVSKAQPFVAAFDNIQKSQLILSGNNHPDVQLWLNNISLNGGSASSGTISALNTFCNSIDSAGLRSKFYRLNLFCGNNLNAALVPLYISSDWISSSYGSTTESNFGFVNADYVENSGLQGNGSKYLLTGMRGTALAVGNRHLSSYEITNATTDYSPSLGSSESNAVQHALGPWTTSTNYYYRTHNSIGGNPGTATKSVGFWIGSDISTTSARLYKNGSTINTSTGQSIGGSSSNPYTVFGVVNVSNVLAEGSEAKLGSYSIGLSLDDSQVISFNNAIQAFQTSLGRNV